MRNWQVTIAMSVLLLLLGGCSAPGVASTPDQETGSGSGAPGSPSVGTDTGSETGFAVAESQGFKAEVTSPISVLLTWTPVPGATEYRIEGSVAGGAWFPVASATSDVASFEVVPIPDELEVAFRLSAVQADGTATRREVTVTTPRQAPNPLTVQATLEEINPTLPGFDPSTFDPSTFDPSTLDPSLFNPDTFDPASLVPQPTTVTQEIGPSGGQMEATSSDGVVYTLTLPEGALPFPLDISMTPILSIDGLPGGTELLGAVQIEPDDIELAEPATLTIRWPESGANGTQDLLAGIGFGVAGNDFHFSPLDPEEPGTSSTVGAAKMARLAARQAGAAGGVVTSTRLGSHGAVRTSPSTAIENAQSHAAIDHARLSDQRFEAGRAAYEGTSGGGVTVAPGSFANFMADRIKQQAQSGSYADLYEALIDWKRLLREGATELDSDKMDEVWDLLLDKLHGLLKQAAEATCMSDAHMYGIEMAQRLTKPASAFDRELLKRFKEKYGAEGQDLLRKAVQLVERCPLYLVVKSDIQYTNIDGEVIEHSKISSVIPLNWRFGQNDGQPYLTGKGDIQYEEFTMEISGCFAHPNTKVGSQLVVLRLAPTFKNDGTVDNFVLDRYKAKGYAREIIIPKTSGDCGGKGGTNAGAGDLWWTDYGAYMMVNGGFPIKDWQVRVNSGMSTIAQKTVNHNGGTIDLGTLDGETTFTLVNEQPQ
jgi:hypothetical protein